MDGPYATLYLDESGGKTWPPPKGKNKCAVYILAGPILTPEKDRQAREGLDAAMETAFGKENVPAEFHYGDLINKRDEYGLLPETRRHKLADDVFELILKLKAPIMGTVIHKDILIAKYTTPIAPNVLALRATVDRFHQELKARGSLGMVMMDTESYKDDGPLRAMIHDARRYGIKIGGQGYNAKFDSTLPHLLNSVGFSPSHMSPGIQLADAIAYATMSHFSRGLSNRFEQLAPLWKMPSGFIEPRQFPRK